MIGTLVESKKLVSTILETGHVMKKPEANTAPVTEPVFVFGSNFTGNYETGYGAFAASFHGAVAGKGNGMQGNSYAIPTHDSELQLLPLEVITNYINGFLVHAANHKQTIFQINRIGCSNAGYKDEQIAPLFKKVGANCRLPGLWLRILDSNSPLRIIVHDPDALLGHLPAQQCLDEFFSINLPLWGVKSVEIVSVGQPKSMVANDVYARAHKFRHRIIGANQNYYGGDTELARSLKAIWYASHLVCFVDPDQTNDIKHVRLISLASRNGLMVEEVKIGGWM
jgi:hypothetical protein